MSKIFLDNEWVIYDYTTLHNTRGITSTVSKLVKVYDSNHAMLKSWVNSGYTWVDPDGRWYPIDNTPYYILTEQKETLYLIDKEFSFSVYTKENEEYILFNNEFSKADILIDLLGYSRTPSKVWDIDKGEPWVWYNQDTKLYWNNNIKTWVSEEPKQEQSDIDTSNDNSIPIYPFPLSLAPQWDSLQDQDPIIWSVSGKVSIPLATQKIYTGFVVHNQWLDAPLYDNPLYKDIREYSKDMFVINPDGITGHDGTHYDYGDHFIGDKVILWEDVEVKSFYRGSLLKDVGKTSDDNHQELYYSDDRFLMKEDLHALGYTESEGEDVEIWDSSLHDTSKEDDIFFLDPNTTSSLGRTFGKEIIYPVYDVEGNQKTYTKYATKEADILGSLYIKTQDGSIKIEDVNKSLSSSSLDLIYNEGGVYVYNKYNTIRNLIGFSLSLKSSRTVFFFVGRTGGYSTVSTNTIYRIRQSKDVLDSLGLVQGTDYFIDQTSSSDIYNCVLAYSLNGKVTVVSVLDSTGGNLTPYLGKQSYSTTLDGVSRSLLMMGTTSAASVVANKKFYGYLLRIS